MSAMNGAVTMHIFSPIASYTTRSSRNFFSRKLISLSVNIGQKIEKSMLCSERSSHTFCARMRLESRMGRHEVTSIGQPETAISRSWQPGGEAHVPLAKQHDFCEAAKKRDFAAVKAKLEAEPRLVNAQPSGRWSALHQFAQAGNVEAVQYLLSKGASREATTKEGKTVTVKADRCGSTEGGKSSDTSSSSHKFVFLLIIILSNLCPFK